MKPRGDSAALSVERALEVLARAGMVAFGGIGIAGSTLPETAAFHAVAAGGPASRPELEKLLESATPAGKIYAATALQRIDRGAGLAAWRKLVDDNSDVTVASGCLIDKRTVGKYAAEQLGESTRA